ncbi:MAG: DUF3662 domain-containing protein [Armatimonadetes bacterium]|nr:DUF3662 domain-containing protein [Armatimonadota bacterium]
MDFLERFNSKFGKWYEGLFGGDAGELRPKDVLRKITAAMEDHRKEGFDNKIYVPNKYVLELAVDDPEERDYLLSFLDEEELTSVLKRFMAQNHYHTRGPLDFTIAELPEAERGPGREKLRVKVRFEKGEQAVGAQHAAPLQNAMPPAPPALGAGGAEDLPTIADMDLDEEEPGTIPAIAWAALAVTAPDGRKSHLSLTRPTLAIGRSRNAGNDLVLDSDGMVSKTHARIERERDGRFTLYDLNSTNGVKVNGARVEGNRVLRDGDEITIGGTKLTFQQAGDTSFPAPPELGAGGAIPRRARLTTSDGQEHVLASETLIGRAVTCDIVLGDPGVATKHARIVAPDSGTYYLEALADAQETRLNGRPVPPGRRTLLADGDELAFGTATLRFIGGTR